jgi:hypothetical protein
MYLKMLPHEVATMEGNKVGEQNCFGEESLPSGARDSRGISINPLKRVFGIG